MQFVIQEIIDTLTGFLDSIDQRVMLIESLDEEAPLILKSFGMVEESEHVPDIFLSFGDNFEDIRRYVESIIERQRDQIEQLNVELAKVGRNPLEQLPPDVFQRDIPAYDRLLAVIRHHRKVIEPERQVIWVIYPVNSVVREEFFRNLIAPLAESIIGKDPENTKLIIRDTPSRLLGAHLDPTRDRREILHYKPEADFKSVLKKTEARAKDKDAPVEERVQSLMLTAGVDVAEKRFDVALAKNRKVLEHYQRTKQRQNESVIHNSIGDIYYLQGQFPEAQKSYETAVTIAVEEKSQPLVLYQSMNLGNALFMQQKFDEALVYYESAEQLAEANDILVQQIPAIERIGETKAAQEKLDEAIEVLETGADICREEKYQLGLKRLLELLANVYERKGDNDEKERALAEMNEAKAELAAIDPHYADA